MSELIYTPLPNKNDQINHWPNLEEWIRYSKNKYVVLLDPFVKHYAGTIFKLGEPSISKAWNDDSSTIEKLPAQDYLIFHLPDSGTGREDELPLYYTKPLSDDVFGNINIFSGPCRITSLTWMNEIFAQKHKNDYAIPDGAFPITLVNNTDMLKQTIIIQSFLDDKEYQIQLINKITQHEILSTSFKQETYTLDCSTFEPGFYELNVFAETIKWLQCRLIKLFPFYLEINKANETNLKPTIW